LTATNADIIHAEFTDRAGITEITLTAYTVTADAAFDAQLIRGAVGAFFVAVFADHLGTLIASVSANAKVLYAFDTFAAFGTKIAACTFKTGLALAADLIVSAVLTFFAASHTDYRAVGAAASAVADLFNAVFAESAFGAVVAITTDAVKADTALDTHLKLSAVGAFFAAIRADIGTLRATIAVIADKLHAHFAHAAFFTVVTLAATACKAHFAVAAQLIIGTVFALFPTFGAYDGAVRASSTAADTNIINAMFAHIACVTEITIPAYAFFTVAAFIADILIRTVLTLLSALFAKICTFRTSLAARTQIIRAMFTEQTSSAEVAVTTYAGETDSAILAKLIFTTIIAEFVAFGTTDGTV